MDALAAITALAAIGTSLMAGVFFAFSTFVLSGLGRLPPAQGTSAMQAVNVAAVRPPFMALFLGAALACLAAAVWGFRAWPAPGSGLAMAGAALYLAGGFGVTAVFNVPLNDRLAAVAAGSPEGDLLWARYQVSWTAWNHLRTVACTLAAVLLALGFAAR